MIEKFAIPLILIRL